MIHLVCYADEKMTISQKKLMSSAYDHGCRELWPLTPEYLKKEAPDFYSTNKDILNSDRGCGYWLWKSWSIFHMMNVPIVNEGDIIFYSDAGVEVVNNLKYITDIMDRTGEDIFLFSGRFPHHEWCKMDVIDAINHNSLSFTQTQSETFVSMNGYENHFQVQASNIFVRVNKLTKQFIKEWLLWCQMPGFIDDSPSKISNSPTFQEHRHDQGILTCLAIKYRINLHWFPSTTNLDKRSDFPNDQYPPLFLHHRRRNENW